MTSTLRRLLGAIIFVGLATLTVACGSDSVDDDWNLDEHAPDDEQKDEQNDEVSAGCETDGDCPDEMYCTGPPECGATWHCQSDRPPCSAAHPTSGCSCDGAIIDVAVGCPPRHAWSFLTHAGQMGGVEQGDRCDVDAAPPLSVTWLGTLSDFPTDVVGEEVYIRFTNSAIHSEVGTISQTVTADGTVEFEAAFTTDFMESLRVMVWWDQSGDEHCTDGDSLWYAVEDLSDMEWDLEARQGIATSSLRMPDWNDGQACERWNGLDE